MMPVPSRWFATHLVLGLNASIELDKASGMLHFSERTHSLLYQISRLSHLRALRGIPTFYITS